MRTGESAMTSEQLDSLRTLRMDFSRLIMQHRFVVDEMLTKISILREESVHAHSYNPLEHISSRVKSPRSLLAKKIGRATSRQTASLAVRTDHVHGQRI